MVPGVNLIQIALVWALMQNCWGSRHLTSRYQLEFHCNLVAPTLLSDIANTAAVADTAVLAQAQGQAPKLLAQSSLSMLSLQNRRAQLPRPTVGSRRMLELVGRSVRHTQMGQPPDPGSV